MFQKRSQKRKMLFELNPNNILLSSFFQSFFSLVFSAEKREVNIAFRMQSEVLEQT